MRRTIALLFASVALMSCGEELPAPTVGCESTRECEFGQICDLRVSRCVPEERGRVQGSFGCGRVATVNDVPTVTAFSELTGEINLVGPSGSFQPVRFVANAPPFCYLQNGVLALRFYELQLASEGIGVAMDFVINAGNVVANQRLDVSNVADLSAARIEFVEYANVPYQNSATRIEIIVDRLPALREPLVGYIDAFFP
jgi:hypothetical protein